MTDLSSEKIKAALREELAERIKLRLGACHPEILSGRFLRELAEVAADEALDFFFVLDEIEALPDPPPPSGGLGLKIACGPYERLRELTPWK